MKLGPKKNYIPKGAIDRMCRCGQRQCVPGRYLCGVCDGKRKKNRASRKV